MSLDIRLILINEERKFHKKYCVTNFTKSIVLLSDSAKITPIVCTAESSADMR